jgi:hypothetical protein
MPIKEQRTALNLSRLRRRRTRKFISRLKYHERGVTTMTTPTGISKEAIEADLVSNLNQIVAQATWIKEHGLKNYNENISKPGGEAMAGEWRASLDNMLRRADKSLTLAKENLKLL